MRLTGKLPLIAFSCALASSAQAAEFSADQLNTFVEEYCHRCHGGEKTEAEIDLTGPHAQLTLLRDRKIWERVIEQVESEEMPSKGPHPSDSERAAFLHYLETSFDNVDWTQYHDPGRASLARLTAIEYRNAIRDIFGIDLQAGSFLGRDPEGNTGFTNDREALTFPLFAFDNYLREAERATDAFLNYQREPWEKTYEAEIELENQPDGTVLPSEDGKGVMLKARNLPFAFNAQVPFPGLYRIEVLARHLEDQHPSGMTVLAGDLVGHLAINDSKPTSQAIHAYLEAGSNFLSFGYEPQRAEIIQPHFLPRPAPAALEKRIAREKIGAIPIPPRLVNHEDSANAFRKLNTVIRVLSQVQRLAETLVERDEVDYETNSFGKGTAATTSMRFASSKVSFNLAAGKVAVLLGVPQQQLEKRIAQEIGFVHDDYRKAVTAYNQARAKKYPERVPKRAGHILLDRVHLSSHGLAAGDQDPAPLLDQVDQPRELLTTLATRAYGRTPAESELTPLHRILASADNPTDGLRDALVGLLVSPPFLLHYTTRNDTEEKIATITGNDLARRLARFLWLSLPDAKLRDLAAANELHQSAALKSQVDRMLDDPRFDLVAETFVEQWLNLDVVGAQEDGSAMNLNIARAMKQEPALLFAHLLREDRSLLELVSADYTFLNAALASHYDIEGVEGFETRRVDLDTDRRGGLLGMGAIQVATSSRERTSPVMRGAFIVEQILGEELPPAPASVPELRTDNEARTIREELELHRDVPECAGCHSKIDPYGFVLENFDQVGRWRDKEKRHAIDARGILPGGIEVNGLAEFRTYAVEHRREDIIRNITERLLEFALGRELRFTDEATIRNILKTLEENDHRARSLIHAIVLSEPFQKQNDALAGK